MVVFSLSRNPVCTQEQTGFLDRLKGALMTALLFHFAENLQKLLPFPSFLMV